MKASAFAVAFLFIQLIAFSQESVVSTDWDTTLSVNDVSEEDKAKEGVMLLDERVINFFYNENNLVEQYYIHQRIYVNSKDLIEEYNKLYIRLNDERVLNDYGARVIKKSGEVIHMDEEVHEGTTEEGKTYKYFAISGAEKGSIIEYYYVIDKQPQVSGRMVTFQGAIPHNKVKLVIASPLNLGFTAYCYTGDIEMVRDSTDSTQNVLVGEAFNIPKEPEEAFSNPARESVNVIFNLLNNTYTGKRNIFNYGVVSQTVFENLNQELEKKDKKVIKSILKAVKLSEAKDDREKIMKLEQYVKTKFKIVESGIPELSVIWFANEQKIINSNGVVKLFFHLFKEAGIKFETVLTCSRYSMPFITEIESYLFLEDYLFYFPTLKDYMAPDAVLYRLGVIPYGYIGNNGLFIREVKVGDIVSGLGKVKYIKPYPSEHTKQVFDIDAKVDLDKQLVEVKFKQDLTGYYAQQVQPIVDYISEEDLTEFRESNVTDMFENAKVQSIEVENEGSEYLCKKPYIINASYTDADFLESAGSKLLFRIGDLIGPQAEMYQEEERKLPVENDYNRQYIRTIHFTIPEGYSCDNLDALNINKTLTHEGNESCGFVSTYKLDGNSLTVDIREYYNDLLLPKSSYEKYREVINAAADFNKVVLVLKKR